ncbi:MAG: hypothetical protein JW940_25160 [Polyangiaceae bacterium]|nr:hypothetical protein [Polyangiaceae bacterium]
MPVKILIVGAAALSLAVLATLAATVFAVDRCVTARRVKIEKRAKMATEARGETAA